MSKPLKVAYLLGSLNRGGTETMILDLVNQSGKAPFDMIGIYRYDGEMSDQFNNSGAPMIKLSPGPGWQLLFYILRLRKLLKKHEVNVIHANQCLDTIYGFIASFGLGIKVIQTVHGFDYESDSFDKLLKMISFKLSHKTIFVSNCQERYYTLKYSIRQRKVCVINNGIDFTKFTTRRNTDLKELLGIVDDTFLMGMTGNFSPGKDQMTVCKFLLLLKQSGFRFKFVFFGGKHLLYPELMENCLSFCQKNGLNENVVFLGKREDVPELLSQLDLFVFSTNHDSFGISVIEALASGIPVLANDWDVMREIFATEDKVILYKSKNEYDFYEKFLIFHSEYRKYQEKARENIEWTKNNFSIQKHIDVLYSTYKNSV